VTETGSRCALKEAFRTQDGSFDLTAFKAFLKENDIEPPKVDMERHGAIGCFWMCAWLYSSSPHCKRWVRGDRQQEYSEAPQVGPCSNYLNSIAPVEGCSSEMSNGDNQNPVASDLVNDPVRKSLDSTSASSFGKLGPGFRVP